MSGGGGKHRGPIDVGDLDVKASTPGRLNVDREASVMSQSNAEAYHPDGGMRSAVVHHVITAFLVAMLLGIGTWGYLTFKRSELFAPGGLSLKSPLFEVPAGDAQLERFRFALDVYFRIYEKYPPDLEALVDEGLLSTSDLSHPPGDSSVLYERRGDTYQLTIERVIARVLDADAGTDGDDSGTEEPAAEPEPEPNKKAKKAKKQKPKAEVEEEKKADEEGE